MIHLQRNCLLALLASGLSTLPAAADPLNLSAAPAAVPVLTAAECGAACCEARPLAVTLGFRTWFTTGSAHDVILDDGAASAFRFRNLDAVVYEFNLDAVLRERFVARVDYGFGTMTSGRFQEVFTPATGPQTPPTDLGNDLLWYVTADLGYRLLQRGADGCGKRKCALDAFVGYQHWQEAYAIDDAAAGEFYDDHYRWDSIRLGLRGQIEAGRWSAQARVAYVPWLHFDNPATSTVGFGDFLGQADGGQGVMADCTVSCRLGRGLALEVGYQVFHVAADAGSFQAGTFSAPLTEAGATRHGLLVGLNYRF